MVYQAPIIALVIAAAYGWRALTFKLEKGGTNVPFYLHYYTIFYSLVLVLTVMAIWSLYTDVLEVSDWMDPEGVRAFVKQVMNNSAEDRLLLDDPVESPFNKWTKEADLANLQWLKYFAFTCPVWCAGTFLACSVHTWGHVQKVIANKGRIWHTRSGSALWNDCIIMILALPMIYGLMSFKSVIRCLQICINHIPAGAHADATHTRFSGYDERKEYLLEMYNTNFAVGDIMETVALVTFGELISDYLKKRMEKTEAHMKAKGVEAADIGTLQAATKTVGALTVSGVGLFCLACLLGGGWDLTVSSMPEYFPSVSPSLFNTSLNHTTGLAIGTLQRPKMKASAAKFFLGFSFAASFAAIGNIMTLEHNYEEFLEEFHPSLKFWGTKILVSLACVQGSALAGLSAFGWSTIQVDLLYACIMCFECFLIALAHFRSWGANEEWLQDQHKCADQSPRNLLVEPLLS